MKSLRLQEELLSFVPWSKRWGYNVPSWSEVWDWSIQCADCGFQLMSVPRHEMEGYRHFGSTPFKVGLSVLPSKYQGPVEEAYREHFHRGTYQPHECLIKFLHTT